VHLHRKADDLEPVGRKALQVAQLLEVAVADLAPGAMPFPDQPGIAGLGDTPAGVREGRIPAPAVGAGEAHPALQQVQGRILADAATAVDEIILAIAAAGAGVHQHDLQRPELVSDTLQLRLDVRRGGDISVVEMAKVELHRRLEAPFERHLVDPPGRLAPVLQPVIHRREEVIGRIQMCAVVGADVDPLHRRVLAVGQVAHLHAHILRHLRRALVMVDVIDLRQHVRRVAGDPALQGDGNVDQSASHGLLPSSVPVLRRIGYRSRGC